MAPSDNYMSGRRVRSDGPPALWNFQNVPFVSICTKIRGRWENEDCTSCTAVRELPATALWGHRASGVVPHRRTGATGARSYVVRQRRLADQSETAGPLRASFTS